MKYGIFLEPDLELCKKILNIKQVVKLLENNAIYVNHPPHLTLYFFESENFNFFQVNQVLAKINSERHKIITEILGIKVFSNDIITGKETVYYELQKTTSLSNFQLLIANALSSFALIKKNDNLFEGDYKKSYNEYGFPFIGDHWIPHFTIASVSKQTLKNLKLNKLKSKVFFNHFSLYKIKNDKHILLKKYNFNNH